MKVLVADKLGEKAKGRNHMFQDPLHDPRVQIMEQERRKREEKGIYKAPPFLLWTLLTLIILILAFVLVLHFAHFF